MVAARQEMQRIWQQRTPSVVATPVLGDQVKSDRSYQIETPPQPAMTWDEYEPMVSTEWADVLDSEPPVSETVVQAFLERHPSMVPGAFTLSGRSGHHPRFSGLISQPPLPSYDRRVPDFMWLSLNSDTEQPVLIEVEAPSKRWFTQAGKPTAQLTQAIDQIAEWKAWFDVPNNIEAFRAHYQLDRDAWMRRRFQPAFVLIYGRRSEANATPQLTKKRAHLQLRDVVMMTYDRIAPDRNADQLITMRVNATGTLKAVSVPPTIRWYPILARDRAKITALDVAIASNSDIPLARRNFLVRRLSYWNKWASQSELGVINMGDAE